MSTDKRIRVTLAAAMLAILILGSGLATPIRGQAQPGKSTAEWTLFTSTQGGFSVKLPSKPTPMTRKDRLLGIEATVNGISCSYTSTESLVVAYVDVPLTGPRELLLTELARASESRSTTQGGKVVSNTAVTRGGCEGRDVVTRGPASEFEQTRIFISGNRIYHAAFLSGLESPATPKLARDYLDSFEVTGGCKPVLDAGEVTTVLSGPKDPGTGWERIAAEDGAFSLLAPCDATLKEQRVEFNGNTVLRKMYTASGKSCTVSVFAVGGLDPGKDSKDSSPQLTLDRAADLILYALKTSGIEADYAREVRTGRYLGREYNVKMLGEAGRAQVYMTPNRVLVFMVICADASTCQENLGRVFTSLRIAEM
jgi:hypothetical protein